MRTTPTSGPLTEMTDGSVRECFYSELSELIYTSKSKLTGYVKRKLIEMLNPVQHDMLMIDMEKAVRIKIKSLLIALFCGAMLLGCSNLIEDLKDKTVEVASITINQNAEVEVGKSINLTALYFQKMQQIKQLPGLLVMNLLPLLLTVK